MESSCGGNVDVSMQDQLHAENGIWEILGGREKVSLNLGHLLCKPITKIRFVHVGAPWLIASSGRFEFSGCDLHMNMFS